MQVVEEDMAAYFKGLADDSQIWLLVGQLELVTDRWSLLPGLGDSRAMQKLEIRTSWNLNAEYTHTG